MSTAPIPAQSLVGVIGAGAMGAGIAEVALLAGHPVRLLDSHPAALDKALRDMQRRLHRQAEKGRIKHAEANAAVERLQSTSTLADFAEASLVVEAIVEGLEAKRALFKSLAEIVRPTCILASNTSSLSITAIAAGIAEPGRVVGMHFFNPAQVMPLVEVVSGLATEAWIADATYRIAEAWGKRPVHTKSTPGFIVNRVARPFYGEALRLVEEVAADPGTLDAVMRETGGFRMGPFELMDLIGLDVNLAVTKSVFAACNHDPRYAPSLVQQELVAAGRLGRKSGRGFFDHTEGAPPPQVQNEAPASAPNRVGLAGELGIAAPLVERLATVGVDVVKLPAADSRIGKGYLLAGNAVIALTDGRSATRRARESEHPNTILFDLAHDFAQATRLAVARSDQCANGAYQTALGLLQVAGFAVSRLDDAPGLVVMRTVAMLANEAAELLQRGVASARDLDLAMQLGTNYPEGPLAWARRIGLAEVREVLANLATHYSEDRYRVAPWITRKLLGGAEL
ncbi:MAG: 3-hydroxyacyl-CoA dehydrogenase [Betaproteobacteria bacterium]|nr:3-hydroxyacyl-CoA dehydrogenase [Betaproteobacteria bacterium]